MVAKLIRGVFSLALIVAFVLLALAPSGALTPREAAAQAPVEPTARPSGGTAHSGLGAAVHGAPLDKPPLKPQDWTPAIQREPFQEQTTPIDLSAPLDYGPPTVPESVIAQPDLSQLSISGLDPQAPGDFRYFQVSDLGGGASLIAEPSHASANITVLETWNWYAAISPDQGKHWTYYDPAALFPASFGGFCCDQVVYYDQSHDLVFWVLQYSPNASGNNAIRLAWTTGSNLAAANFCYTDFTPQQLGDPTGANYDQPKFARSNNDYYMEITRYGTASGSVVIRIAASAFNYPTCGGVGYDYYFPGLFSPGFTQRAYSTMYFAGHVTNSTLRVFTWPESVGWAGITTHDVAHSSYPQNYPYSCPRTGGSSADASDWCQRRSFGGGWAHSDRIFNGWISGGRISFVWDASQGTGSLGTFPYPYLHAVQITETTYALASQPILWMNTAAAAWSSSALDDRLHAAMTFMWGGGDYYENCAVTLWDDYSTTPPPWTIYAGPYGNINTNDKLSGDYTATRRNAFDPYSWSGSCYAPRNNGRGGVDVHVYYLWFGRTRDAKAVPTIFLPLIRRAS